MTRHVLVLGGTGEARLLAAALVREPGVAVTSALAGRVAEPRLPRGRVRIGGFGGADGLAAWLREQDVAAVVDATHPFAARISANAVRAAAGAGIPLLALRRPGWTATEGDRWHPADSAAEAAELLPGLLREAAGTPEAAGRVFLTTGRMGLAEFAGRAELARRFVLLRAVERPEQPLPPAWRLLLDRGPFTLDGERALLREHRIDVLVTKDSGGAATAAKLTAAREAGLPVVLLRRPPAPPGVRTVPDPDAAVRLLRLLLRDD
ncbi:cobalt-precorrin-6A reductase [Streptacidiphilus cavernicola]|uniref:Cobalt-precorrin-6A reductase n=1 Tax=Streptacidiphilus cavernicola TaxID=3342716 RepID=A0ABV6W420_9ACTN